MSTVEKLQADEARSWARVPGNKIYRYQVQSHAVAFLMGFFFVSVLCVGIFAWSEIDNSDVYMGISLGFAVWALYRLVRTFYTLSRKLIGLSPVDLLLVENNSATRIPLAAIEDNGFTDAEKLITTKDYIKIRVNGRSFKITTMNPFLQLEHLPEFLATLLERTDPELASSLNAPVTESATNPKKRRD